MALKSLQGQGINLVGSYQLSGVPFVTSSATTEVAGASVVSVKFPYVTRWVEVTNIGDQALRVGFSENGVLGKGSSISGSKEERLQGHKNYYVLGTSGSHQPARWELRCSEMFFSTPGGTTGFSLIAGLTGIKAGAMPNLTGSNGFIGVG
jgi:hypothetical protein